MRELGQNDPTYDFKPTNPESTIFIATKMWNNL
jgi:hypothetical protein